MRVTPPRRLSPLPHGITLIEMLVVIVVIGLVTGITLTGITFSTPRRQVAVSTLKGTLDQTRAYAVEKRRYTALMVVDGMADSGPDSPNLRKYAVFEIGELGSTGEYVVIQPARQITEWKTLPGGVVFLKDDASYPTVLDTNVATNLEAIKVRTIRSGTAATSPMGAYPSVDARFSSEPGTKMFPGIVFAPNGAVASPRLTGTNTNLNLCVVEGTAETSEGKATSVRTKVDSITEGVRLTRLTGVSRYLDPDLTEKKQDDPFNMTASNP